MEIQPFQTADGEALLALFQEQVPVFFAPHELGEYADYLQRYADAYCTMWQDQQVAGGFGYVIREEESTGSVTWIFVGNCWKGAGLGQAAVAHCHAIFQCTPTVQRYTVRTSQHAFLFFRKQGYQVIETVSDYWAPGLDLYVMERLP